MKQNWQLPTGKYHRTLLYNARVIDPATNLDVFGGVLVDKGEIIDFGAHLAFAEAADAEVKYDCGRNVLCPGLIDMQVHFREPGFTFKEDLHTGSKSAAAGGITRVVCQPNTKPVIDSVEVLDYIRLKAKETSYINIHCYASISKNMEGKELSDFSKLVSAGAVGFTDDGLPVMNSLIMRRALEYSKILNVPIAQHAEDLHLSNGGAINEGAVSFELGVGGIPAISESVMVARDIDLVKLTKGYYHVLHVSAKESIEHIRCAKELNLPVTCEVAPHHLWLTDKAVLEHGTNAKMNPPLKSEEDRQSLIQALKNGVVDAIATDHAPHDLESKSLPLAKASFGIVGVETMLPLTLELYHDNTLDLITILGLMTYKPADIIRAKAGRIAKGYPADLTLIDIDLEWVIKPEEFASKSKNSPFVNRKTKGRAIKTFIAGELVYEYQK